MNDSKRVSVLLAVYNPKTEWLLSLYDSFNSQVYKNIKIYVKDDCSDQITLQQLNNLTKKLKYDYVLTRNEKNIGSTKTFELLTIEADGDFFVYCDQDDIWYPERISELVNRLNSTPDAKLCYSDFHIINDSGLVIHESYTSLYPHHTFKDGTGLYKTLLKRNLFPGCAMIIDVQIAKASVPFPDFFFHDHWLTLNASVYWRIIFIDKPLLGYRIHTNNQTNFLKDVISKETYYKNRIVRHAEMLSSLRERFEDNGDVLLEIDKNISADNIRKAYFKGNFLKIFDMLKLAKDNKFVALFEILGALCPDFIFKILLKGLKNR